jgi:2-polyprenyl-3-methyl-5-hydroxy-6-metoxy-1,4-benzoquinol methylase
MPAERRATHSAGLARSREASYDDPGVTYHEVPMTNGDRLSSVEVWEQAWQQQQRIRPFNALNYFDMRMHRVFSQSMRLGDRVVEVGCGGSRWLSYFDEVWKAEVWGIDYSETGYAQSVSTFTSEEKRRRIILGDFFAENGLPQGYFDLVYSLGFVEHFSDVPSVLRRCLSLCRPGGHTVTMIPNFSGWYGPLQKFVGPDLYAIHNVMDAATLDRHHVEAGFEVVSPAAYWGCFGPLLVSWTRWNRRSPALTSAATFVAKVASHGVCWPLHAAGMDVDTQAVAPNIVGIYRRRR